MSSTSLTIVSQAIAFLSFTVSPLTLLRVLNETVKHLQHDFKRIEGPFLITAAGEAGGLTLPGCTILLLESIPATWISVIVYVCLGVKDNCSYCPASQPYRILIRKIAY